MRQLATIQKIAELSPIEGADQIEKARVLGWELVVKKGDFGVGESCVYIEIDSIVPEDNPYFEFLKPRGFKIKTIKLRKQISQGLACPMTILPFGEYRIGDDVTEILKIKKHEPEIRIPGYHSPKTVKYYFPSWMPWILRIFLRKQFPRLCKRYFRVGESFARGVPKTDETRIQVLQHLLNKYAGTVCYITEKLDGSSVTYYLDKGKFGVCSRNIDLDKNDSHFWKWATENKVEEKIKNFFGKTASVAIQGEIIGPGIQKNKYKLQNHLVFFYNVWDIKRQKYLEFADFYIAINEMGLRTVPVITTNHSLETNISKYVKLSIGKSVIADIHREGIIIRPMKEIYDPEIKELVRNRISFKIVNPIYLLKYDE